jgi:hypothetical protein
VTKDKTRILDMRWVDPKDRTWEVFEMVRPGLYRVRTTTRQQTGEMYAAGIRKAYAAHGIDRRTL